MKSTQPPASVPPKANADPLAQLRLSKTDYEALQRNGSVEAQYRRGRGPYYRLRFRRGDGKQRVRYIGRDARLARAIEARLRQLQQPLRRQRELRQLDAQARRLLRRTKQRLQPQLRGAGRHFHGFAVRRTRQSFFNSRSAS